MEDATPPYTETYTTYTYTFINEIILLVHYRQNVRKVSKQPVLDRVMLAKWEATNVLSVKNKLLSTCNVHVMYWKE
jgi:hypothetical protein